MKFSQKAVEISKLYGEGMRESVAMADRMYAGTPPQPDPQPEPHDGGTPPATNPPAEEEKSSNG